MAKQEMIDLQAQVEETVGVEQSAALLIGSLKTQLTEAIANQDWPAVIAMRDKLDASEQALAAAVAANSDAGGGEEEPA